MFELRVMKTRRFISLHRTIASLRRAGRKYQKKYPGRGVYIKEVGRKRKKALPKRKRKTKKSR